MVYAVVILIVFTSLIRLKILFKPFYIHADKSTPLGDTFVLSRLKTSLAVKSDGGIGIYIDALGIKTRLYKVIGGLKRIACGDRASLSRFTDRLISLYGMIDICTNAIYAIRYPLECDVPRVYRICADISKRSIGELTRERLEAFTSEIISSELFDFEKNTFRYILALCYIDIAARSANKALNMISEFIRGQNDGAMRKIDLLSVGTCGYSTGVTSVLGADEKSEYINLASCNGVDLSFLTDRFHFELSNCIASVICAYRSAATAVKESFDTEKYGIKAFGGETEYKRNTIGRAVTVLTDNRGKVEICGGDKSVQIDITCNCGENTISLASCDGVMSDGRTVYHGARDNIELNVQIVSPPDMCAAIMRISVVNRSCKPLSACLTVKPNIDGEKKTALNNIVYRLDDGYMGIFSDGKLTPINGGCAFYCDLSPFEKQTVNTSVVFGSKYAVNSKGVLSLSDGCFEMADIACGVYRRLNSAFVCDNDDNTDILCGVEYYRAEKNRQTNVDRADIDYGYSGNVYRTAADSGLINAAKYGKTAQFCSSDGRSVLKCGERELSGAIVFLEEDGTVFSPSVYPCGAGKAYTEFLNGKTVYKTLYNGLECTLERFIAAGHFAERLTLTVSNSGNRPRVVYGAVSVRNGEKCAETDSGVVAECSSGGYITAVTSAKEFERGFFKEGYFKHGKIEHAHGFRSGGVVPAPTLSVKLTVPPHGSCKVDFALIYSVNPPDKAKSEAVLNCTHGDEILPNGEIYIEPKTSDNILNAVYSRARYLVYSGLCKGCSDGDGEAIELLKLSRSLYARDAYGPALRALMSAIGKIEEDGLLFRGDNECGAAARLIYGTVTENLFGIKLLGDTGYVYPQIGVCPFLIEYEVRLKSTATLVKIDGSEQNGEWVIKQGIITRSCGAVKFDGGEITVVRDGKTRRVGFSDGNTVK